MPDAPPQNETKVNAAGDIPVGGDIVGGHKIQIQPAPDRSWAVSVIGMMVFGVVALVVVAGFFSAGLPIPPASEPAQPTATPGQLDSTVTSPGVVPSATAAFTPSPLPTSTLAPTFTPTPACVYAGEASTDEAAWRYLIDAEARVTNQGDLELAGRIFAPAAIIRDMVPPAKVWPSPARYYQEVVFPSQVRNVSHTLITILPGATPLLAYATSGSVGEYGVSGTFKNSAGSDHWVFGRPAAEACWTITRFDFNASGIPDFPP